MDKAAQHQEKSAIPGKGALGHSLQHDSAAKHVAGAALYVDDLRTPPNCLHLVAGRSERAHARIVAMDLDAVRSAPGVLAVLTAEDIPGDNDVSPTHSGDEPLLPKDLVTFHGQALFVVAAETRQAAQAAVKKATLTYEDLPAILEVQDALAAQHFVAAPHVMKRGAAREKLATLSHTVEGSFSIGGQEHFYLEGQVSLALPLEDGDVHLHCSTQHPSEVQHLVAQVMGRPAHSVTVETRRMGGAFGGKESQAAPWAALAALVAVKTGRPAKFCLDRDDDMVLTGKRHPFWVRYEAGYDAEGRILALALTLAADCGHSLDLSSAIADRAMFHADNCYYIPDIEITCYRCKTHKVSNTAFRGFGGPQGMMAIEQILEAIARAVNKDPLDIRKLNFYGTTERNITPYHMTIDDNVIAALVADLEKQSDYHQRRQEIAAFNAENPVIKKGLALTPVKFGISFTTTFLNQAGALIHIYHDGSVHLNHGGTEMGQGLFIKVAQLVADEFQIGLDAIKISATHTGKVPNTSATAASSGTDMNGMAALNAARSLKRRLIDFASQHYDSAAETILFKDGHVLVGDQTLSFATLVKQAYLNRVSLSATGFYRTPKIHYDRAKTQGRPFYYFAYGAAVSEVAIDVLTGETQTLRVDILHDVGRSLNPAIDAGQIEGGFIQGLGWLTSEELWWDDQGRLRTHAPSTYKIPACSDRPRDFRLQIWQSGCNVEETVHKSKAVGEPPFMLAISVFQALNDALFQALPPQSQKTTTWPLLHAPATPEEILRCLTCLES